MENGHNGHYFLQNQTQGGIGGVLAFQWSGSGYNYNVEIWMADDNNGNLHQVGYIENDTARTTSVPNRINDFTGQHRCLPKGNIMADDSYGLIVYSTGEYININGGKRPMMNESLPICDICNIEGDKRVFGVISDDLDDNDNRTIGVGILKTYQPKTYTNEKRIYINSLGEGSIWVCNKNGDILNGSYIKSSTVPGYGILQVSDNLLNSTVAKITCDCTFNLTKVPRQKIKTKIVTVNVEENAKISREETTHEVIWDEEKGQYIKKQVTKTIYDDVYETFTVYDENGEPAVDKDNKPLTYRTIKKETHAVEKTEIDYDENGDFQYVNDLDEEGNVQMDYKYDTRFLNADGSIIPTEEEYKTKLDNSEEVYIAQFVGYTYHYG